ncbi:hypothetical protein H072_4386 [Dactylellina haptotyla CBS 200.50]|uniref:Molybdopterin synthase sulfur carrier subunit n=1 Tax=Dactylellina haptotyla (strain CBS 200.50) TaxID=1284197 RepID=S8AF79_DACHA|nr:hypothetical protein H072_4386 [Dactylellina haptotyla CBS 200.50]
MSARCLELVHSNIFKILQCKPDLQTNQYSNLLAGTLVTAMADTFKVLYFAAASTYTGKAEDSIPGPMPVSKLFAHLEDKYPGFRKKVLTSCALSVNLDYVDLIEDGEMEIQNGDEVGIIPPVSSG